MSRAMSRWTVAGALALAAVGAIGGFTPGVATAAAAPSVSPFAGTFSGNVPGGDFFQSIRISDRGRVSGSTSTKFGDDQGHLYSYRNSLTGTVSDAGALSVNGTVSWGGHWVWYTYVPAGGYDFNVTAAVALDSAGNLVGTTSDGAAIIWSRR
jgi:hypothetical protein